MSKAERRPTTQQVDLLAAVEAGRLGWTSGRQGHFYAVLDDGQVVTAAATRLLERGWIEGPDGGTRRGAGALTRAGEAALQDARDQAAFDALPYDERAQAAIHHRPRGSNWQGRKVHDGREVRCSTCARHGEQSLVWYTNEGGAPAQREAERVRRDHVLEHVRSRA